eukprot:5992910-Amphidinium_carterae.3
MEQDGEKLENEEGVEEAAEVEDVDATRGMDPKQNGLHGWSQATSLREGQLLVPDERASPLEKEGDEVQGRVARTVVRWTQYCAIGDDEGRHKDHFLCVVLRFRPSAAGGLLRSQ